VHFDPRRTRLTLPIQPFLPVPLPPATATSLPAGEGTTAPLLPIASAEIL
jgi:hypothetical protein